MGLKPTRNNLVTDNSFYSNAVATKGGIVTIATVGSGQAMDLAGAVATYAAAQSGKVPLGVLLEDVVNEDLTDKSQNYAKTTVQLGGKLTYAYQGIVVTNMIAPNITPALNDIGYLAGSGYITNVNSGVANTPKVGKFLSTKDEDGYAKFKVEL